MLSFWQRKIIHFGICLICSLVLTMVVSLLMIPKVYKSEVIFVTDVNGSVGSTAGISALFAGSTIGTDLTVGNPNQVIAIGMSPYVLNQALDSLRKTMSYKNRDHTSKEELINLTSSKFNCFVDKNCKVENLNIVYDAETSLYHIETYSRDSAYSISLGNAILESLGKVYREKLTRSNREILVTLKNARDSLHDQIIRDERRLQSLRSRKRSTFLLSLDELNEGEELDIFSNRQAYAGLVTQIAGIASVIQDQPVFLNLVADGSAKLTRYVSYSTSIGIGLAISFIIGSLVIIVIIFRYLWTEVGNINNL